MTFNFNSEGIQFSSNGEEINNEDITVTSNGEYTAGVGYTGLGTVTVNVEDIPAVVEELNVTPTTSAQTIRPETGKDGFNPVNVAAVTSSIDANITAGNIKSGVSILGVNGSVTELNGQTRTVSLTNKNGQTYTPTNGKNAITSITVAPNNQNRTVYPSTNTQTLGINSGYSGNGVITVNPMNLTTKNITANGTYYAQDENVDGYNEIVVNVAGGGGGESELDVDFVQINQNNITWLGGTNDSHIFVAVGENDSIAISQDATNWTTVYDDLIGGTFLQGVAVNNLGVLVAVGVEKIIYSNDLTNFSSEPFTNYYFNGVAFGNNTFVCVGGDSMQHAFVVYGTPNNWNTLTVNGERLNKVIFDGTKFVAVGTDSYIGQSSDGANWNWQQINNNNDNLISIAYDGNGEYVILKSGSPNVYVTSDFTTFTEVPVYDSTIDLLDILYYNNQYVILGDTTQNGYKLIVTLDFNDINTYAVDSNYNYFRMFCGGNKIILCADNGYIAVIDSPISASSSSSASKNFYANYWIDTSGGVHNIEGNGVTLSATATSFTENDVFAYLFEGSTTIAKLDMSNIITLGGREGLNNMCTDSSITDYDFYNLTTVDGDDVLSEAFYGCSNITYCRFPNLTTVNTGMTCFNTQLSEVSLPKLTTISSYGAMANFLFGILAPTVTEISLPSLTTVSGKYGMSDFCQDNPYLTSFSVPNLTTLSGDGAMEFVCYGTGITQMTFPSLSDLSGSGALRYAFASSPIQTLSFPALTSPSYDAFEDMLNGVSNCTVHFPSNLQLVIDSWQDVLNGFGGTNTMVLFDLPATE